MANRIFYACQQVGIKPNGTTTWGDGTIVHGVQSVGLTTNFNLSQVFELGQISIYENIEDIPDVEVSMTKVLDGYIPMYLKATSTATSPTLVGRSNERCIFGLSIFNDTLDGASGTANQQVECSGMYVSSISYSFPLEDNFTEDMTLVGNHKIWKGDSTITAAAQAVQVYMPSVNFSGGFAAANDEPAAIGATGGGVNRRQDLLFATGLIAGEASVKQGATIADLNGMHTYVDVCALPTEIPGINSTGQNVKTLGVFGAHINSITVSADLGREQILELGRKGPYHRFATFPTEVTCEIETTSVSGDLLSATEEGRLTESTDPGRDLGNLSNQSIRIATAEGTRLGLGAKNKLSSVNYAGGDAGGGNVTTTFSYTNFNDLTVIHSKETAFWSGRNTAGYLYVAPAS